MKKDVICNYQVGMDYLNQGTRKTKNMRTFLLILYIIIAVKVQAQDIIDAGNLSSSIQDFRTDLDKKFSFGETYRRFANEDPEAFVKRILNNKSNMHHGAFELNDFRNCIVSFAQYEFQEISIIIGFLLEPTSTDTYKLLKTMELSSGCGEVPKIKSVFLHDSDSSVIGRELIIHASDYCGRHGKFNYVFIYNRIILSDKLKLQNYLEERCGYSEVKINGEWDFDMGDENVEERRHNKCKYQDYKAIRKYLDNIKSR